MPRYEVPLNGAGPYYLVLYTSQSGRNVSASINWRRDAYGYSSFNGGARWSIVIAGVLFQGAFNFSAPAGGAIGEQNVAGATQYIYSGNNVGISGSIDTGVSPGSATAYGAEYLATVPAAPSMRVPDQVTQTSMRIVFSSQGDGGSPVTSWGLQRATDPGFTQNVVLIASSGTSVVTGLAPGTTYYWRARGQNAVGVGGWSNVVSATTLPAVPPGMTVDPNLSGASAVVSLTPPGGISGVLSYTVERRPIGTTDVTSVTGQTSITVNGLIPGATYEWRSQANFTAGATSPWTDWIAIYQPNPNTNPGDYFDGATGDTADLDFGWQGTVNNSVSRAVGLHPTGWADFAQASEDSGGDGAAYRVTGAVARYPAGQPAGAFSARYAFFADADEAGFRAGTDPVIGGAEVSEGGTYFASIYVQPSRSQRLAAGVSWYDASGNLLSRIVGGAQIVTAAAPVRLSLNALCPEDGTATVEAVDVSGDGWSLWLGGDTITTDGGMITVGSQYPYFDGNTPDTTQFKYDWLGATNASVSTRTTLDASETDPLADPDCPAPPSPPTPPQIDDDCITDVGVWRRYWLQVPPEEVSTWMATIPTMTLNTGAQPAREVRIRVYENPDNLPASQFPAADWSAEQIVRYIPENTQLVIDGVSERARASVNGGSWIAADHLLYGTGGGPATWPLLSCGVGYLISLDVPLDAALGNLTTDLALTRRML